MSVQHQGGRQGTHPTHNNVSLHLDIPSAKCAELNEQLSAGDDFALKVRKPYTMTKQRERWTDEEHKKFLDALELYGRAWKHIEAHVGTKTAVQIRSHAQKFFSKVERESDNGDLCTGKPIEIPPPRPKRKPYHPYPRKLLSTVKSATPVPEKQTSLSPQHKAHQSPTSVLSASCVNTPVHYITPGGSNMSDSSNVCANFVSLVVPELPHSSPKVEVSLSSEYLNKCQDQHDRKTVKLEFVEDNGFVKEGSEEISTTQCFKLFGKTVLVTNSCWPSSPISSNEQPSPTLPAVSTPVKPTSGDTSAMSLGMHVKYFQTFSRQADQEGPPIPFGKVHSPAPIKVQPFCDNKEEAQSGVPAEFDSLRNISLLGNQLAIGEKCIRKPRTTAFSEKGGSSFKCLKGFMPYKRCKDEQDAISAIKHEENEQGIRLCL